MQSTLANQNSHNTDYMKKYLAIMFLLAVVVWACGGGEENPDAAATEDTPAAAAVEKPDGKKIYKQYCVTCHGLYGDMGASGAFNLQESSLPVAERVQVITNGRGAMTPFGSILKPEEIEAVAEYTLTLKQ